MTSQKKSLVSRRLDQQTKNKFSCWLAAWLATCTCVARSSQKVELETVAFFLQSWLSRIVPSQSLWGSWAGPVGSRCVWGCPFSLECRLKLHPGVPTHGRPAE